MSDHLVLGTRGRIVIPFAVRRSLGLVPGDRISLGIRGRRIVLERPEGAVADLRGLAAGIPPSRSLVDEPLAVRRAAAAAGE